VEHPTSFTCYEESTQFRKYLVIEQERNIHGQSSAIYIDVSRWQPKSIECLQQSINAVNALSLLYAEAERGSS
jgi:hypothetical protein